MTSSESAPVDFDVSKPSISRVYDALLGGKDYYPSDEHVIKHLQETMPEVDELAKLNRAVLGRGVKYLAGKASLKQYLDLGAGLPTMENTHQVAQAFQPEARVVYVDKDPIVLAHGRALLGDSGQTRVITADLRDPAAVLAHPDVQKMIDFSEPVAVMLVGMLHHLHDDEDPEGVVDGYMDAVPVGSHLFITHFLNNGPESQALEKSFLEFLGTGRFRTEAEIKRLFRGYELVEPGLVPLSYWRPDTIVRDNLTLVEQIIVGGIAVKS
ncbi:SAM-dependent methyltransferase [Nocardia brasiliensis]|uniref:SAM-dependent methyltransferase n=1 Tax=Nocardia brasiliensis TaxID=37326 RepID=A0A6G9XXL5_NOCBR|nr:SAM-dependent methyltransferase [Nocardia brasiliensis]QIS05617.1 SAM-dependent methyltransferase [Nocardia brasiliensis]